MPSALHGTEQCQQAGELAAAVLDRRTTRRTFVRGIAAAGASSAIAAALDRAGVVDLFGESALAGNSKKKKKKPACSPFSEFTAIAPSPADALQVPAGFRVQVLLRHGDTFKNGNGDLTFGYNNDWIGYFPLNESTEGLLFINHEYPAPFYQHGFKPLAPLRAKTPEQIQLEQDSVGNSIVHVRRASSGLWEIVSPSKYNRRIYGDRPKLTFTGPRKGDQGPPMIGDFANGSVGNCSGGTTPWGTALSCEENYDGYGLDLAVATDFAYGWPQYGGNTNSPDAEYRFGATEFAKYGWVCEHDPYDPKSTGRKHTALGRFRHENTAYRHVKGKPFVLYMGDDRANEGVYKFISTREYKPDDKKGNLKILETGTLYAAKWSPEGRRRFAKAGDTAPLTGTSGTGEWVEVLTEELDDTATKLRTRIGAAAWDAQFATNRPEDVEIAEDGTVVIALTNNSSVRDSHGSVRVLREDGKDPTAKTFTWQDFAAGGPTPGGVGFSSPDNLTFDADGNLWVVTDISSSRLNKTNEYTFHANNAMFMVPTIGPNAGVAFRFANMPVESEGTGPYFTPDYQTMFLAVQHPGEEAQNSATTDLAVLDSLPSWWPNGNRTTQSNPAVPLPAVVAITRDPTCA